jgi:hypothetical protein
VPVRVVVHSSGLSIGDIAGIVGAVAALIGLRDLASASYKRTIGRRGDLTRRLQRLGTGGQLDYVEAVLGEPPAMRRSFERERPDYGIAREEGEEPQLVVHGYLECIFINPLVYVQTISDEDSRVVGFSITTRSRRFHPELPFPARRVSFRERLVATVTCGRKRPGGTRVILGRTTFLRARPGVPRHVLALQGNKYWSYAEISWGGNPGFYQDLVLAATRVSPVSRYLDGVQNGEWEVGPETVWPEWISTLRSKAPITTMVISAMGFSAKDWPTFGPTVDEVRTLP